MQNINICLHPEDIIERSRNILNEEDVTVDDLIENGAINNEIEGDFISYMS
jgi:hypothetical protein